MKSLAFFVFFLGLFVSCGGEWTAADSTALSCRISDVPFTSAEQISLSADGEDLYILDRFNHVYVYGRNDARTCAFELFRTPENSDGQIYFIEITIIFYYACFSDKNSWIPFAAAFPAPIARITVAAPVTASPPA